MAGRRWQEVNLNGKAHGIGDPCDEQIAGHQTSPSFGSRRPNMQQQRSTQKKAAGPTAKVWYLQFEEARTQSRQEALERPLGKDSKTPRRDLPTCECQLRLLNSL